MPIPILISGPSTPPQPSKRDLERKKAVLVKAAKGHRDMLDFHVKAAHDTKDDEEAKTHDRMARTHDETATGFESQIKTIDEAIAKARR